MVYNEYAAKIKFKSTNFIPDNTDNITIGNYIIEQIPSAANSEGIINFSLREKSEEINKDTLFRRTYLETKYFLSFLSLISRSNCEFQAGILNLDHILTKEVKYSLTKNHLILMK